MNKKTSFTYVQEVEEREAKPAILLLDEIVSTPIGKKAFEAFGVQYPVEFLVWCFTINDDMLTHIGYMPVECLESADVLVAASIACGRRSTQ